MGPSNQAPLCGAETYCADKPLKAGAPPCLDSIEHKLRLAEDYLLAAKVLAAQTPRRRD